MAITMTTFTLILCLASGVFIVDSAEAEAPQMNCNFTTDFALDLLGCAFQPLEELIGSLPFSSDRHEPNVQDFHPYMKYTIGKHMKFIKALKNTKTVEDVFKVVRGAEQEKYENILEKMNPKRRATFLDETSLREHVLMEIINNVDFDEVADTAMIRLLGSLGAIKLKIADFTQTQGPIDDLVCLTSPKLCRILKCMMTYSEASLEDDPSFAKCLFQCSDLPVISRCMHDAFEGCQVKVLFKMIKINLDWIGDLITRIFMDLMELDKCIIKTPEDSLTLTEGISSPVIEIEPLVPPGVLCFNSVNFINTPLGVAELLYQFFTGGMGDCKVEIQISTSNYIRDLSSRRIPGLFNPTVIQNPVCRSGARIPQYAIGWHQYANQSSGVIRLTNDNWNDTIRIPVEATIDYKALDSFKITKVLTNDSVTVKVVAGLFTKYSVKIPVTRVDKDEVGVRSCWIVNGPHIKTFDGHYYHNFYEGHFVMYRHKELPYEVQTVAQKCSNDTNTTCACAASVRSGDDVFTVDFCRRKGQSQDDVIKKVTLFLVGELTTGTRIFRHDGGLTYQVLLPHGTLITITSTDQRLNVWIRPSPYDLATPDKSRVEGLCGDFNNNATEDLILRDGTPFTGNGSNNGEQPQEFNKDWRITNASEIILKGANDTIDYPEPLRYCTCSHTILLGVQCNCNHNRLVSDCDINTDGELPELFPSVTQFSQTQRNIDQPGQEVDDILDFSDDYMTTDPEIIQWEGDTNTEAVTYCKTRIETDAVQLQCRKLSKLKQKEWNDQLVLFKDTCQSDIQLTGGHNSTLSSVVAARQHCHDYIDVFFRISEDNNRYKKLKEAECPNDCSPHLNNKSSCFNATCICDDLHTGPDCSIRKAPAEVVMPKYSHCDIRYQNCSFATVFGKNFVKDNVKCVVNQAGKNHEHEPNILSPNQLACKLPDASQPAEISLSAPTSITPRDQEPILFATGSFEFRSYDSQCFTCSQTDGKCVKKEKQDHCLVESSCYMDGEISADDKCYSCNATNSMSFLTYSTDEECVERRLKEEADLKAARKERNLRIVFSCLLCGLVIIITIIAFIISKKTSKNKKDSELTVAENGDLPAHTNLGYEMEPTTPADRQGEDAVDHPGTETPTTTPNGGVPGTTSTSTTSTTQAVPGPPPNEINAREMAEFWKIKHAAMERARIRTESVGSKSSIASTGIGGSGPSHFSAGRMRSSTGGSYGMGAAGPAHLGRFARRAYSGGTATDDEDPVEMIGLGGGGKVGGTLVARL